MHVDIYDKDDKYEKDDKSTDEDHKIDGHDDGDDNK